MARVVLKYIETQVELAERLHTALEKLGYLIGSGSGRMAEIILWSDDGDTATREALEQDIYHALARDELILVQAKDNTNPPEGFGDFSPIDLSHWDGDMNSVAFKDLIEQIDDTLTRLPFSLNKTAKSLISRAKRAAIVIFIASVGVTGGFAYQAVQEFEVFDNSVSVDSDRLAFIQREFQRAQDGYVGLNARIEGAQRRLASSQRDVEKSCNQTRAESMTDAVGAKCEKISNSVSELIKRRSSLATLQSDLEQQITERANLMAKRAAQHELLLEIGTSVKQAELDRQTLCIPQPQAVTDPKCDEAKIFAEKLRADYENSTKIITRAISQNDAAQDIKTAEVERDRLCTPKMEMKTSESCEAAREAEKVGVKRYSKLQSELERIEVALNGFGDIDTLKEETDAELADVKKLIKVADTQKDESCDPRRIQNALSKINIQCNASTRAADDFASAVLSLQEDQTNEKMKMLTGYSQAQMVEQKACTDAVIADKSRYVSEVYKEKTNQICKQARSLTDDLYRALEDLDIAPENNAYNNASGDRYLFSQSSHSPGLSNGGTANARPLKTIQAQIGLFKFGVWRPLKTLLPTGLQPYGIHIALFTSVLFGLVSYQLMTTLGRGFGIVPRVPGHGLVKDHSEGIDVFVSFAQSDRKRVLPLVASLRKQGLTVWCDRNGVMVGEIWAAKVVEAIRAARYVAVVGSKSAYHTDHVYREVNVAAQFDRKLRCLTLEPAEPTIRLNYFLSSAKQVDLNKLSGDQLRVSLKKSFSL